MRPAPVAERRMEALLGRIGDAVDWVEAATLRDGLSPRLGGIDAAHVRRVAQLAEDLPPLVVHRDTMRVVDGAHRLAAAQSRRQRQVPVVYFDGTDDEAFVVAIYLNAVHGKALGTRDRTAAVQRLLGTHPNWSDRWIACICGVAPRKVAALRKCVTDHGQALTTRVGRDGRLHPLSTQEGRRLAEEIMRDEPGTSLRQVARRAGVSVGTALDVRRRILAGTASAAADIAEIPGRLNQAGLRAAHGRETAPGGRITGPSVRDQLEWLAREPSLRYTDRGRALLRLVSATLAFLDHSGPMAETVPGYCRRPLDTVVRACAGGWLDFAEQLEDAELLGDDKAPAARAA